MVTIALSVVCPMKWVEGGGVTAKSGRGDRRRTHVFGATAFVRDGHQRVVVQTQEQVQRQQAADDVPCVHSEWVRGPCAV